MIYRLYNRDGSGGFVVEAALTLLEADGRVPAPVVREKLTVRQSRHLERSTEATILQRDDSTPLHQVLPQF